MRQLRSISVPVDDGALSGTVCLFQSALTDNKHRWILVQEAGGSIESWAFNTKKTAIDGVISMGLESVVTDALLSAIEPYGVAWTNGKSTIRKTDKGYFEAYLTKESAIEIANRDGVTVELDEDMCTALPFALDVKDIPEEDPPRLCSKSSSYQWTRAVEESAKVSYDRYKAFSLSGVPPEIATVLLPSCFLMYYKVRVNLEKVGTINWTDYSDSDPLFAILNLTVGKEEI